MKPCPLPSAETALQPRLPLPLHRLFTPLPLTTLPAAVPLSLPPCCLSLLPCPSLSPPAVSPCCHAPLSPPLLPLPLPVAQQVCAICLERQRPGAGQALFTAECGHTFHFPCIASSVAHGNKACPLCRQKWNYLPSLASHRHVHCTARMLASMYVGRFR